MKRLFLGVPVSEDIKKKVEILVAKLSETGDDFNFIKDFHFTIKFLGDVDESEIEEIKEKIDTLEQSSFSVHLRGVGVFPHPDRIRVIWIGIDNSTLTGLMKEVNNRLQYIRKDDHKEVPHLTVARVKSGKNREELQIMLNKVKNIDFGKMIVDSLVLYESELTPTGPIYRKVFTITFK